MLLGFELCPGHFEHFQVFVKFWRTYILWVWVSAGICQVGQSAAPATFQGLCFHCQFSFRAVAVLLSAVGSWAVVWPTVQASRRSGQSVGGWSNGEQAQEDGVEAGTTLTDATSLPRGPGQQGALGEGRDRQACLGV